MIGENPLRASDLDVVDEFEPTISPPMTKLFQQLVDRAASHLLRAQAQQKLYADKHRKDVEFQVGDKSAGWKPAEEDDYSSNPVYEVEHILDSRGSGRDEEFLIKWKGYPDDQATWEPLSNLTNCKDLLRAFRASRTRQRRRDHRDA
ncbi:hypothetical protein Emag_005000 [Eimeria magna]